MEANQAKIFPLPNKWFRPLRRLTRDAFYETMMAYFDLCETGKDDPELKPMAENTFLFMSADYKAIIDSKQSLSEARREAGRKGGERKQNKQNQANQAKPLNIIEYNEIEYKESTKESARSHSSSEEGSPRFIKWNDTVRSETPYIAKHLKPLTEKEFDRLITKYGDKVVYECLLGIENRKDLRKKYSNLYRTLDNWCKKATAEI